MKQIVNLHTVLAIEPKSVGSVVVRRTNTSAVINLFDVIQLHALSYKDILKDFALLCICLNTQNKGHRSTLFLSNILFLSAMTS